MNFVSIILISLVVSIDSYKILVFYSIPIKSVNILGEAQVKHLINAGHEVTYVTSYPPKKKPEKNYREIDVSEIIQQMYEDTSNEVNDILSINHIMKHGIVSQHVTVFQQFGVQIANLTFSNKNIIELLSNPREEFDAVLVDLYESEIYAGLSSLYKCPMIWSHSMGPNYQTLRLVHEVSNPAYTPDYISINMPPFDLRQRVEELWGQIVWTYYKWFFTMPAERTIYEDIFKPLFEQRGDILPPYEDVIYNASLILSNDFNIGGMPSLPQNYKLVGGFHVDSHKEPLPKDLLALMDNSKNGVIYFSMGSTWQSKDIPESVTNDLLKMFGELKQTVIWKYEDNVKNLPKNVYIMKWAPQPSILSHPNCLFFITHGGKLSSVETLHYGVPTIGIPIFIDQFVNINKAVSLGYALKVELNFDLARNLKLAIETMINEPKYRQRAKELSIIYHDRPTPPHKELVHWVDHVVRTRGAMHLRSPALFVPWYQKMYLDLAAILITIFISLCYILKSIFLLCRKKPKNSDKKKN